MKAKMNTDNGKSQKPSILITSSEGEQFSLPFEAIELSEAFKNEYELLEGNDGKIDRGSLNLTSCQQGKIKSLTLSYIIKFLTHFATKDKMNYFESPFESNNVYDIVQPIWYADFIVDVGKKREELLGLVLAADFLDIQPLLRLSVLAVSCDIAGRTEMDISCIFKVHDSYQVEQETVSQENKWAIEAKAKSLKNNINHIRPKTT